LVGRGRRYHISGLRRKVVLCARKEVPIAGLAADFPVFAATYKRLPRHESNLAPGHEENKNSDGCSPTWHNVIGVPRMELGPKGNR
jgi:hypothetical protein